MRNLLALLVLLFLAGPAFAQGHVFGATSTNQLIYQGTVRINGTTFSVPWATQECLGVFWSGNVTATGSASDNCSTPNYLTQLPVAKDMVITGLYAIPLIDSPGTPASDNSGCDLRVTADGGSTDVGNTTISIPDDDGEFFAGEVFGPASPIATEVSAGEWIEFQIADGTYCPAGTACDCGDLDGDWYWVFQLFGYYK